MKEENIDMTPEAVLTVYNQVKELAKYNKKYSDTYVASLINLEKVCHLNRTPFNALLATIEGAPGERKYRYWKATYNGHPREKRPVSRAVMKEIPDSAVSAIENFDGSYDIRWRDAYTEEIFAIHIPPNSVAIAMPLPEPEEMTAITLCSGVGAMDEALRQAGYKVLAAVDPDQNSADCLRANFPETVVFQNKVEELTDEKLRRIHRPQHIHMSPPCQDASAANPKARWDGPLNVISFGCLEIVQRLRPDTFTLEEVEGFTRDMMDPILIPILSAAKSLGYRLGLYILHGTDAGSCQTRPRFVIIAYREDLEIEPTMPQPVPERQVRKIKDLVPDAALVKTGAGAKQRAFGADGYLGTVTRQGTRVLDVHGIEREDVEDLKKLFEFPLDFKFLGSEKDIRNRIGNCVIPKFGKWLMDHVKAEVAEGRLAA
jgi:site-specific DNA-cytosine methylase